VLENPMKCEFDPQVLACKGADSDTCLTDAQVAAVRRIYSKVTNPRTGEYIFPGFERGSELGWSMVIGPKPFSYADDFWRYVVVKDASWDFEALNYETDLARAVKEDHGVIDATDPNLRPFFSHGGKLLQYHGWNDPGIAPENSVNYYNKVGDTLGGVSKIENSYRLFMVPGMSHCRGGEGTDTFDMLAALERWVEQGKAPDSIPASRVVDGKTVRTRPLCPYPQEAVYKGSGSTDDAANFACRVR
jgi:feruloyl esterase